MRQRHIGRKLIDGGIVGRWRIGQAQTFDEVLQEDDFRLELLHALLDDELLKLGPDGFEDPVEPGEHRAGGTTPHQGGVMADGRLDTSDMPGGLGADSDAHFSFSTETGFTPHTPTTEVV